MVEIIVTQLIVVLINAYIATTEKIKNIYIVTFLFNLANLIMYAVKGDKTTSLIYIVINIRSLVYIYKDKIKSPIVPFIAIALQLIVGFTTIENIWQLIPILTPCWVCYYMWFCKTTQQLRINNAICNFAWLIYNFKTGLYIVAISRLITVLNNIVVYTRNRKKRDFKNDI